MKQGILWKGLALLWLVGLAAYPDQIAGDSGTIDAATETTSTGDEQRPVSPSSDPSNEPLGELASKPKHASDEFQASLDDFGAVYNSYLSEFADLDPEKEYYPRGVPESDYPSFMQGAEKAAVVLENQVRQLVLKAFRKYRDFYAVQTALADVISFHEFHLQLMDDHVSVLNSIPEEIHDQERNRLWVLYTHTPAKNGDDIYILNNAAPYPLAGYGRNVEPVYIVTLTEADTTLSASGDTTTWTVIGDASNPIQEYMEVLFEQVDVAETFPALVVLFSEKGGLSGGFSTLLFDSDKGTWERVSSSLPGHRLLEYDSTKRIFPERTFLNFHHEKVHYPEVSLDDEVKKAVAAYREEQGRPSQSDDSNAQGTTTIPPDTSSNVLEQELKTFLEDYGTYRKLLEGSRGGRPENHIFDIDLATKRLVSSVYKEFRDIEKMKEALSDVLHFSVMPKQLDPYSDSTPGLETGLLREGSPTGDSKPYVIYKEFESASGVSVICLQNSFLWKESSRGFHRIVGDLYAIVDADDHVSSTDVTNFFGPPPWSSLADHGDNAILRILDIFDSATDEPLLVYANGPRGNGHYLSVGMLNYKCDTNEWFALGVWGQQFEPSGGYIYDSSTHEITVKARDEAYNRIYVSLDLAEWFESNRASARAIKSSADLPCVKN